MSAWAVLQSAKNTLDGASVAATFTTANVQANNKIIVFASGGGTGISATISTVRDGASNNWTQCALATQSNAKHYIYALDVPAGDVGTKPTITVTWSGSVGTGLVIQEVSGLALGNTTAAMLDGTPGTLGGTAATTGSPTYSSSAAGAYLVASMGDFGAGNTPVNAGGWTLEANSVRGSTSSNCVVEYKDSTGGSESDGFTSADTNGWAIAMVAFKLAVATFNSGPNSPGSGTDLGGGTGSWTNPGNITADDGSAATWAA